MKRRPLTTAEIRELDRRASEDYGIPPLLLMENAARSLADQVLSHEGPRRILVICGKGNNGGDGLAAARHLSGRGARIEVLLLSEDGGLSHEAQVNCEILKKTAIPFFRMPEFDADNFRRHLERADWVLDAMLGVGVRLPMRDPFLSAIKALNRSGKPVTAADIPSGLDSDTGETGPEAVKAVETVTFAAPKTGLFLDEGPMCAGNIIVGHLGLPIELLDCQGGERQS